MKNKIIAEIKRVNGANIDHLCDELSIEINQCISLLAELDEESLVKFNTVGLYWQLEE